MSLQPPTPLLSRVPSFERSFREETVQKRTLSKHRHAAPSAPWPWIDLDDQVDIHAEGPVSRERHVCPHERGKCVGCWAGYPQSLYPNWTWRQVDKSGITKIVTPSRNCLLHYLDIDRDAHFSAPIRYDCNDHDETTWKILQNARRPENTRVRCLFIDKLSLPLLKMLGTKYDVEPFFWTSSINWIPARYQENINAGTGDHITIALAFPRVLTYTSNEQVVGFRSNVPDYPYCCLHHLSSPVDHETIDTQKPLPLRAGSASSERQLVLDMLAIHMIRSNDTSTIISYQPIVEDDPMDSDFHNRIHAAGQSVYWKKTFQASKDPTFILLPMLWYAMYAWDQALEYMWEHICSLELTVLHENDIVFTQELHRVRAYLLHYASLLEDFHKSVKFVCETPNPALDPIEREISKTIMKKEGDNLLIQIERLQKSRVMWDDRLTNVMQLGFNSVNINDSKYMKRLTEATVRDSAAMKQIAYLTMVFLPATFVASAFGMNVKEVAGNSVTGTLAHYVETAIPLTIVTIWIIVALQATWLNDQPRSMWIRLAWPALLVQQQYQRWKSRWSHPQPVSFSSRSEDFDLKDMKSHW